MVEQSRQRANRMWWWVAAIFLVVAVIVWATDWWGEPDERIPPDDVGEHPQIETAPDEEEIEEPNGPLDRPPGTAPADPRRPATVPHSDARNESSADESGGDDESESRIVVEEPDSSTPSESPAEAQNEPPGEIRRVPAHLRDRAADGERRRDAEDSAGGGTEDDAGDTASDSQGWAERRRKQLERAQGSAADDGPEGDEPTETDGEWVDGEEFDATDEEFEATGEEFEDKPETDDVPRERADDGAEWRADRDFDDVDSENPSGELQSPSYESESTVIEERSSEPPVVSGGSGGEAIADGGERSTPNPPADEAADGYSEVLDDFEEVDSGSAASYSAMAMQGFAESLYLMSAGRTLSESEAARQREEVVDSVSREDGDEEDVDEEDVDEEEGPAEDVEDRFGDDWTAWLDAADWLRMIQQREYPDDDELIALLDELDELAEQIDPELAADEQIHDLVEYYETVEIILEEMALHHGDQV